MYSALFNSKLYLHTHTGGESLNTLNSHVQLCLDRKKEEEEKEGGKLKEKQNTLLCFTSRLPVDNQAYNAAHARCCLSVFHSPGELMPSDIMKFCLQTYNTDEFKTSSNYRHKNIVLLQVYLKKALRWHFSNI